jgi:ribonuclease P protein component
MTTFSKTSRLTKNHEFKAVFADSTKIVGNFFILLIKKNNLSYSRLGLVITKKKIATAVQRNRIRRLIREVFRLTNDKNISTYDMIFMAKYNITSLSNQDIIADIKAVLTKI